MGGLTGLPFDECLQDYASCPRRIIKKLSASSSAKSPPVVWGEADLELLCFSHWGSVCQAL